MTELPIRVEFDTDTDTHEKIFDWAMKTLGEGNFDYFVSAGPIESILLLSHERPRGTF